MPTHAYDDNRALFAARRAALQPLSDGLTRPLLIRIYLGEGEFGWVHRVWNASSGTSHAEKTPKPRGPGFRDLDALAGREACSLRGRPHGLGFPQTMHRPRPKTFRTSRGCPSHDETDRGVHFYHRNQSDGPNFA